MFNLEKAISAWLNSFKRNRHFFSDDIEELERHVRDHVAGLVRRGADEEEAFLLAVRGIGGLNEAETEYRKVYWQKIRYRGVLQQTVSNELGMIKTYIKLAARNLMKHKMATFINIAGFSTAIGCCLVIFSFIDFQYNIDTFHQNARHIFQIQNTTLDAEGKEQVGGQTPVPLSPALEADFSQVEISVRLNYGSGRITYGEKNFVENLLYVDPGFLDMFTYPLRSGDPRALFDRNAVVFTSEIAEKYFGRMDPVGEEISISFNEDHTESFVVRAVLDKLPNNRSWDLSILVPYQVRFATGVQENDWTETTWATLVQISDPSDVFAVGAGLGAYVSIQNAVDDVLPVQSYFPENLLNLSKKAYKTKGSLAGGSHPAGMIVFALIGLLLLLLATFNYVNIAIASATRRYKEIGIRKVVGSTKTQLIRQFVLENMLLSLLALVGGIVLAESLFIPGFHSLFGDNAPDFGLDYFNNARLWLYLVFLLLVIGLGSGAYPAFYISAFSPIAIFRNQVQFKGKNRFTRTLVAIQFVVTFIMMVIAVGVTQNKTYQKNRTWGYDPDDIIVLPVDGANQWAKLRNDLSRLPTVELSAGSQSHIGGSRSRIVVRTDTSSREVLCYFVGPEYIETMGLTINEGRSFDAARQTDLDISIIVNQAFVKEANWAEAIDRQVVYDSTNYHVIGVVDDFMYDAYYGNIDPVVLLPVSEKNYRYLSLRARPGTAFDTNDTIRERWAELVPDMDYAGFLQKDTFEDAYAQMERDNGLFKFISLMALVLSCMGILGLVALSIARRQKDLSIHKVMGATTIQVLRLVSKEFLVLAGLALVIASPLGYWLLKQLLDVAYTDHIPIGAVPFIVSAILVLGALALTISTQVYKATSSNPVDALQGE